MRFSKFLTVLGTIFLVIIVICIGVAVGVRVVRGRVPNRTILEVNLEKGLIEDVPDDPMAKAMLSDRMIVRDVVDAIDRGADDSRVVGMVASIGSSNLGVAEAQEIRDAVLRFRARKKFAVAFSETFGEAGPGQTAYYLATAFDQIYLQPSGDIGLTGIMWENSFLKGTLSKLGMQFHGDHRYEYKSALNRYTETKFTPAHREENERVITSWYGQELRGIAEARHLTQDEVRTLVDRGPFLGKEALAARLVDGMAYRDEVYDQVKKKGGPGTELLYLSKYLERAERPHNKGQTIALIYGVGAVTRGKSGYDPIFGGANMGSDTVAAAFRAAVDDKDVKAIIFRIDSPGGSYVASDTIWREVMKAKKAGKPVIATMGDLAGSGGYFVAMAADKIVAQPGTITASIGVLSGKLLTSGFWNKVGLSWDEVHAGANASIWTGLQDYTPAEWQRFQAWLDRIYVDFTGKVADGRKLPLPKVLEVAKGRIWTGEDAKNLGLVDELGGFDQAIKLAKKAANIPETEEVNIKRFPKEKSFVEALLSRKPDNSERETSDALVQTLRVIQPVASQIKMALPAGNNDVLRMPEVASEP
ncbi:MAG TPA: signal peptide peptidase SppA [Terriglobales bacterium]|nr:signal peptide peptidase SppA [Terriglobales bacterium]